ncbi:MAG TPA: tetratricopeptide repeat protein [Myxococcaceae bacterium]
MHARTPGLLAISLLLLAAAPAPSPDAQAAFDRGERALAEGRLDQAIAAYKEALSKTPGYAAALNGLGLAFFKQDRKPEAIQQFRAATEANPSFALAWSNLGFASRKMGDGAAAVAAYEKYVALAPDDPDGLYGLAESYRMAGDSAKAIPAYEQYVAKERRPSEQKWVQKARDQIAALKAPASGTATAAAPVPPPSPASDRPAASPVLVPQPVPSGLPAGGTAAPALAQQRIADGDAQMKGSRYRDASFAYQDAVNADPSNTEALFKLARAFATLGYYQQAIEKWGRVIEITQDPAIKKSCQDNILRAQAKLVESGGSSPQAQGLPPGSGPIAESTREKARQHYEQGVLQINGRDFTGALASLTQTIQLEPTLAIAYVARGSANIGLRRYAQAAADYQYALKLDGRLASPLYGLGEAYRGLGRPLEARGWYEKYIASQGTDAREDLRTEARQKLQKL